MPSCCGRCTLNNGETRHARARMPGPRGRVRADPRRRCGPRLPWPRPVPPLTLSTMTDGGGRDQREVLVPDNRHPVRAGQRRAGVVSRTAGGAPRVAPHRIRPMVKPDELIVDIAARVESGQSSQMSLTVVTGGAVITGRLAPESVWRKRVAEVLKDSEQLAEFASVFDAPVKRKARPPTSTSTWPGSSRARSASRRRAACTGWRSRTSAPGRWATSATPDARGHASESCVPCARPLSY